METTARLHSWSFTQVKTYLFATLFIAGNILFPQLCHTVHMGGPTWLPIYFFTLIAGYKYGCKVGILTAVLSPVVNHLLFGMPAAAMLPAILVKSSLLAVGAAFMAHHTRRISLAALAGVILFYQVAGGLFEWMFCGDFYVAIQDFRIGIPGLLVQWIGGYLLLRCIAKY